MHLKHDLIFHCIAAAEKEEKLSEEIERLREGRPKFNIPELQAIDTPGALFPLFPGF